MVKKAKMMKTVVALKQHLDGVLCENYSYNCEMDIQLTAHFECAERRYFSIYTFDKEEQLLNVKIYTGIHCPKPYRDTVLRYMNETNEQLCFGAFRLDDVGSVYYCDTFKFHDGPVKRRTFDQWFRKVRKVLEEWVHALDALSHGKEAEVYKEFFPARPFRWGNERWRNHRPPLWIRTRRRAFSLAAARSTYEDDFEEYEEEENNLESREDIEKLSNLFQNSFSAWDNLVQEALDEWDDRQARKEEEANRYEMNTLPPDISWEELMKDLDEDTKTAFNNPEGDADKHSRSREAKEWRADPEFEKWLEEINQDEEESE